MSTFCVVFSALIAFPACAHNGAVKETANSKGKLIYIEGTSDLFANFKARACQSNIHISSRMGGSMWREDNAKKVAVYNNENKVYCLQNVDDYLRDLTQDFMPMSIEELEPPVKTTFDGRPAKKYLGYAHLGKLGRQCVAEITCIENIWLTPAAHRMWCRFLGLNRYDFGLPVVFNQKRASVLDMNAKVLKLGKPIWVRVLATNKIKEMPSDVDSFSFRSNWKLGKDKAALLFSKDGSLQAKDLDDFFRSNTK